MKKLDLITTAVGFALAVALIAAPACKKQATGPQAVTAGTTTEAPPVDPTVVPEGSDCVDSVGNKYPNGYKYAVGTQTNATHFECRDGQFVEVKN